MTLEQIQTAKNLQLVSPSLIFLIGVKISQEISSKCDFCFGRNLSLATGPYSERNCFSYLTHHEGSGATGDGGTQTISMICSIEWQSLEDRREQSSRTFHYKTLRYSVCRQRNIFTSDPCTKIEINSDITKLTILQVPRIRWLGELFFPE